ncbi:MAG: hypothetical protein QM496_13950 [Verrucomicrobiota bacterium]
MLFVSTANLQRSGELLLSGFARGSESVLGEVMSEASLQAALVTPPGSPSVQGNSALERGKRAVTANVLSVVRPIRGAVSTVSTAGVVRAHRRGGRTRRRTRRLVVSAADFESYIADKHRAVGYTAGGWAAGVALGSSSLPDWMNDASGPGSVTVRVAGDLVVIEVKNEVSWISDLAGMAERLATVMTGAEEGLTSRLIDMLDQQARATGF